MKQATTTIVNHFAAPHRYHPLKKIILRKNKLFTLLACTVFLITSCRKENHIECSPFKGQFAITLVENGVTGVGEGSHIGKFTLIAKDNEENFPEITGTVIITSANGDQIFATHTGLAQELGKGMLQVNFENTISGGTGRFKGATGNFQIHALVNEEIGKGNATFEGTICY